MVALRRWHTVGVDRRAAPARRPPVPRRRPRPASSAPSTARWPAASTSSSCATRTPATTSCSRPRARFARALPTPRARSSCSTTGPTSSPPRGADGVHVGQDDVPVVARARARRARPRSSASRRTRWRRRDAARRSGADYIAVGPVHATPTKAGRPAIGLEPVALRRGPRSRCRGSRSAASTPAPSPPSSSAGARRIVVVRAIADAADPEAAARALRAALDGGRVGAAQPQAAPAAAAPPREPPASMRRGYARAEERNAARARDAEPLAPGERPPALVDRRRRSPPCSAVANVAAWAAGLDVDGRAPRRARRAALRRAHARSPPSGMWRRRYWAVLGFEALLGDHARRRRARRCCVASNVAAVVLCVAILGARRLAVLEARPRDGQAPGSAARSLDSGRRHG